MKTKKPKKHIPGKKQVKSSLKPSYYLLLMAYIIIPVVVPNFNTFDAAGPKFLALALLNLIGFIILFADSDYTKRPEFRSQFFRSFIGIAYTLFLCISLLSFINAINLTEALLNFIKTLTVFATTYILFVIFSSNRSYLHHLAIALTMLLLVDCLSVFYNMLMYISREVTSIMDIKSVYSHKNILTSVLFVKIPAALYLIFFSGGWKKIMGYIACLFAVLSILLLSTRAFYLGLGLLVIALFIYALMRQLVLGKKGYLLTIVRWAGLFIAAVVIYTVAQQFLFPKNTDTIWNTGIVSRLSSISAQESSTNARLGAWGRSIKLIGEHPLLGVGTGNWKIVVMKYENQDIPDFTYMIKNHNDFLEITAETGLPGGLIYISLFILVLIPFIRASLKPDTEDNPIRLLFIPAFGILAYSVDAFFNFPADRPEVQSLFAIYIALLAAYSNMQLKTDQDSSLRSRSMFRKYHLNKLVAVLVSVLLLFSCWILIINVRSLHYQLLAYSDISAKVYTKPASFFIEGFPSIPTVSCFGEPIAVIQAKYLMHENRYREAINLLKNDSVSPWDSRREYQIAKSYYKLGKMDSVIWWGKKAYRLKPYHQDMIISLSDCMFREGQRKEATQILFDFLEEIKTDPVVWNLAANQLQADGHKEEAIVVLDSALKYLPGNTSIIKLRNSIAPPPRTNASENAFNKIMGTVNAKQYPEAIGLLNDFIVKHPGDTRGYTQRAFCFYIAGKFAESINDINQAFELGVVDANLLNLRGISYHQLGNLDAACRDFKEAMEKGSPNGKDNYQKFCGKK